jgi:acetoin utilization protein AcuC
MKSTAVVYDEGITSYDFGPGHPFRGNRFKQFMIMLEEKGLLSNPKIKTETPEEAEDVDLLLVHSQTFIDEVRQRAELSLSLTPDTPLYPSIIKAARLIVGASIKATELVVTGDVEVAEGVGGGLHHAGRSYGGGFCVFNDVAICAQALLERYKLDRVLIFDSDVHAGNGTMDIFYDEPKVLFTSVHQDPKTIYPGTGFVEQLGQGPGEGYTVNIPLPPGADDMCMELVLNKVLKPLAKDFRPQIIIRNGGSDPHHMDGLGRLNLTYNGLRSIGMSVSEISDAAGCGVVDLCCSGYNPSTIAEGWLALLSGVIGYELDLQEPKPPLRTSNWVLEKTEAVIVEVKKRLNDYWNI